MDDDLFDEVLGLCRWLSIDHDDADDETLAQLILWDLREVEILDLAADSLPDHTTSLDTTEELALIRIRGLVHAYRKYGRHDRW